MFGVPDNHVAAGALAKHSGSCPCVSCQRTSLAKRDIGNHEEKMHLASANAMHHSSMQDAHQRAAYGYDRRDSGQPDTMPVEMKAKHLEAAAAHGMAREHFQDAARSYRDGLPKGAAEHEKIAGQAAEQAKKLTEKLKDK